MQIQEEETVVDERLRTLIEQVKIKGFEAFQRPSFPFNQNQLNVMLIDIDYFVFTDNKKKKPMLRIFGATESGMSVLVLVQNFQAYFYIQNCNPNITTEEIRRIQKLFSQEIRIKLREQNNFQQKNQLLNVRIEVVQKQNIKYFKGQKQCLSSYLKIFVSLPSYIPLLRNSIQKNNIINDDNKTYESALPFILRFMIDKDIVGMGWIHVKNFSLNQYSSSFCQIQIKVDQKDISEIPVEGQWSKIAPMRVLSFDIECDCEKGFPSEERNPVIQIACVCKNTMQDETIKIIFVLNECTMIPQAYVRVYQREQALLSDFQIFVKSYDPDFIIGYNIINFDFKYLINRARKLRIEKYGNFGRMKFMTSSVKNGKYLSKAMGMRQTFQIQILGRIQFDLIIHMHREFKLSSYSLNNVSYQFLREQKQDVHHSNIHKLFLGGKDSRKRLALYCLKDAYLPLKLFEKLMCLYNYSQMSRVSGVTINLLLKRGQQIKVISMLYRKAQKNKMIIPKQNYQVSSSEVNYQGAYVLQPKGGFYQVPIATLDFSSLYPSIMIAHNLCYSTLITPSQIKKYNLTQDQFTISPQNHYFVKSNKRKGLLPQILEEIITARKKAKKMLKEQTDPLKKAVLDGRQLALKISANSVYGFTGASAGQLPCIEISSSITAFGRKMIEKTKNLVEDLYKDYNTEVIYGDTDSVMINFKLQSRQKVMELGLQASQRISKEFLPPIKLEFEKVYHPFLLITKKRYAGLYFTNPNKYDKIDSKGLQSIRRDNCKLIRSIMERTLHLILVENNIKQCVEFIKKKISELYQNKIDISQLVITKALTKNSEDDQNNTKSKNIYKVKQAHVELADKMKKRDETSAPQIGDRIPYVIIEGTKGSKTHEKAQNPLQVLDDDLSIDYDYYINKQIKPPLQRLLKYVVNQKTFESIFSGQHTKHRYVPKIKKNKGLGTFLVSQNKCYCCKKKIGNEQVFCQKCQGTKQAIEITLKKIKQHRELETSYNLLWNQCQRCQGSYFQDIICSNSDCEIFYSRIKIKKELNEIKEAFK